LVPPGLAAARLSGKRYPTNPSTDFSGLAGKSVKAEIQPPRRLPWSSSEHPVEMSGPAMRRAEPRSGGPAAHGKHAV